MPAAADETQAREILKAMSDYLASQQAFGFDYDATLEVVTTDGQKLALASSGTVEVERPDRLHATRAAGFADVEIFFDGKEVSIVGNNLTGADKGRGIRSFGQHTVCLRNSSRRFPDPFVGCSLGAGNLTP